MIVQILPADVQDIPEIRQLAYKIWNQYYPDIIGQDQIDYMLEKFYSESMLKSQMSEGQEFYFIRVDNNNTGFIAVSERSEGEYFIHKFYIDTQQHRRGIGTLAFEALIKRYPNASSFSLQVNRQNFKPINFYFKLGFVIEKVADFDISNGYFMNDFVMVKRI